MHELDYWYPLFLIKMARPCIFNEKFYPQVVEYVITCSHLIFKNTQNEALEILITSHIRPKKARHC